MKHFHESLTGFPVVIRVPVLWGDQDSFGHVNNIMYLKWSETARVDYLVRVGLYPPLPPDGIGPILASISCDYKRPLNYPDTVQVGARVRKLGNSSMKMEHRIVSESLNTIVAELDSTVVVVNYTKKNSVPIPDPVRKAIQELEGKSHAG
jgi:acyl-CoA thioester hydrolase